MTAPTPHLRAVPSPPPPDPLLTFGRLRTLVAAADALGVDDSAPVVVDVARGAGHVPIGPGLACEVDWDPATGRVRLVLRPDADPVAREDPR